VKVKVCVRVCVGDYVRVCERERECVCVCVCDKVCVCERVRERVCTRVRVHERKSGRV